MRCEPLWDANALSTESPCPPACRNYQIQPGYFCGVCLEFHPRDQHRIDTSNPPPPENAEDRALRHIREWEVILGNGEGLKAGVVQQIRETIAGLKKTLKDMAVKTTTFAPSAPGGTGNLKAKSLWTIDGLDFKVQAHTKGEAVQAFALALRKRGEAGRFSVSIANPKRVK